MGSLYYKEPNERNQLIASVEGDKLPLLDLRSMVVYQVFIPGFIDIMDSEYYFFQLVNRIPYFTSLGINTIELFPVEQYTCHTLSSDCNCWDKLSIEYPGIVNFYFGSSSLFRDFVSRLHPNGIRVLLEVSWALFDATSVLYDNDCADDWGSFFKEGVSSRVDGRAKLDLNSLKQTGNYVKKVLARWRNEVGVDGIVWNDAGCLLYTGQGCLEGMGVMDLDAIALLRELQTSSDYVHVQWFLVIMTVDKRLQGRFVVVSVLRRV